MQMLAFLVLRIPDFESRGDVDLYKDPTDCIERVYYPHQNE